METPEGIIARLEKLESKYATLHKEHELYKLYELLYAEVKALRNNYKSNNKLLANHNKIIPRQLKNIIKRFDYADSLRSIEDDDSMFLHDEVSI